MDSAKRGRGGLHKDVRPWTEEEDARFRRLWREGRTLKEIGIALDRTEASVKGRRERLELPYRPRRRYRERKLSVYFTTEQLHFLRKQWPSASAYLRELVVREMSAP